MDPASLCCTAGLGRDTKLGTCKILAKTAEFQRGIQRVIGEGSVYLQRVFKKLLRSTTCRKQTELPEIKAIGTVAKGLTGATWAPEWSADSWGGSWQIVCRLGKKNLAVKKGEWRVKKVFDVLSQLEGCSHQNLLVISLLSGHWFLEYKPHNHNAH